MDIKWSADFAYAIGLFTADGSMSKDGRHFDFTSKDREQVETFAKCLNLKSKISGKSRGYSKEKKYFHIQFGDIKFYKYLLTIGLQPRKSLTIKKVDIPDKFFPDFIRGYLDGDGSVNTYSHPESNLVQLKIRFYSGSKDFLAWLKGKLTDQVDLRGGTLKEMKRSWWLVYSKRDSLKLIKYIYYSKKIPQLKRKSDIAAEFLRLNKDFLPERWQNRFTAKV